MQSKPVAQPFDSNAWVLCFIYALTSPMECILRRRMGARYVRYTGYGLYAVLGLLLFTGMARKDVPLDQRHLWNLKPVLWFLAIYAVRSAMQNLQAWWQRMYGLKEHSLYTGCPYLMYVFRWNSEKAIKCWIEPLLVCVAGYFITQINVPLGGYCALAALFMMIKSRMEFRVQRERAIDIYDAESGMDYLENEAVAGRQSGGATSAPIVASINPDLKRKGK